MIELYTWGTPNGRKVSIMLEECGLPWAVHPIDIGAGEQFDPAFLRISPNNKIPAIVDHDGPDGKPITAVSDLEGGYELTAELPDESLLLRVVLDPSLGPDGKGGATEPRSGKRKRRRAMRPQ